MNLTTPQPFVRRAGAGATRDYVGHLFTFHATARDTAGQFSVIEATVRQGHEPPPHVHAREDELFHVLDGVFTFVVGDTTIVAEAGTSVFMPRGIRHRFTVDRDGARALITMAPGGLEQAFIELSVPVEQAQGLPPAPEGPPPVARMLEVFAQYDVDFGTPA